MEARSLRRVLVGNGFDLAISVLVVLVLAGALLVTLDMGFRGRLFPQAIIVPTLVLALVQLGLSLRRALAAPPGPSPTAVIPSEGVPRDVETRRTLRLLAWLFFWMLGIWLVGFTLALGLGVFLYTLVEARRPWWQCVLMGAGTWAFVEAFLVRFMHLLLPAGQLASWLSG